MTCVSFFASSFSFVVVAASLASVGCAAQTEPTAESDEQTAEAQSAHRPGHHCVQNALCVIGKHWDANACACVSAAADAGPPHCVQNVLCTQSKHWDHASCRCVATCVDNIACVLGSHWDAAACTCVPSH